MTDLNLTPGKARALADAHEQIMKLIPFDANNRTKLSNQVWAIMMDEAMQNERSNFSLFIYQLISESIDRRTKMMLDRQNAEKLAADE